mgnify:CR=1 FL=1
MSEAMEHVRMRWVPEYSEDDDAWVVVTECRGDPWFVCQIVPHLPGDDSGELTAKAICDAHNAALEKDGAR